MKYVELLKSHYKDFFQIITDNMRDGYGQNYLTMNFVIVGSNAENRVNEIQNVIKDFFEKFLLSIEDDGELKQYISYNSSKSNKEISSKIQNNGLNKVFDYLSNKQTDQIVVGKYEVLKEHSVTNEKRYGECYGKIDYKNYKYYTKSTQDKSYEIRFILPYHRYEKLSQAKKEELLYLLKNSFCSLNAISALVTYYRNFELNTDYGALEKNYIYKIDGEILYGSHWCNMLCENQINLLGGIEKIKERFDDKYIIEEHITNNGEKAILIQLTKNDYELELSDLKTQARFFSPHMLKVKREYFDRPKQLLKSLEVGTTSYDATLRMINENEFILNYILMLQEDDLRWID